jgi:4,5-DOPA dioxygenase extradiol
MTDRMPALFIGHGNPMNALADNEYTRAWNEIGRTMPRPRAILVISAHWYLPGMAVTAMARPQTIHDFGGFPRALFEYQYPARGDEGVAREVQALLQPLDVKLDYEWGLDHGAWAVLCHIYPQADVPVVQLSIDETLPAMHHYRIGLQLAQLRERGILVLGSGNVVHNLHTYAWGKHEQAPYDWAARFEQQVRDCVMSSNHEPLINYERLGRDAALSAPTPEHYLPLLYVLGTAHKNDLVSFPVTGMDGGSISMLSVKLGT